MSVLCGPEFLQPVDFALKGRALALPPEPDPPRHVGWAVAIDANGYESMVMRGYRGRGTLN